MCCSFAAFDCFCHWIFNVWIFRQNSQIVICWKVHVCKLSLHFFCQIWEFGSWHHWIFVECIVRFSGFESVFLLQNGMLCSRLGSLAENRLREVERWGWLGCRWIKRRSIWGRMLSCCIHFILDSCSVSVNDWCGMFPTLMCLDVVNCAKVKRRLALRNTGGGRGSIVFNKYSIWINTCKTQNSCLVLS